MDFEVIAEELKKWASASGIRILIALVIMVFSFWLINVVDRKIEKRLLKKNVNKAVMRVVKYLIRIALKIIIVTILLEYLGVSTASIAALLASLGVGLGFALQGTVTNIAGGIILLITRPFKIDDWIEACDIYGEVTDIRLIYTYVRTLDTKVVALPNGTLANTKIVNLTAENERRYNFTFSISYSSDYKKAEKIIEEVFAENEKILHDRPTRVRMIEHGKSSIDIAARAWVKTKDFWPEYYNILEEVKDRFDREGIEIPYQQIDVHIRDKR